MCVFAARSRGFTLAELLVASVVGSLTLLGAYAVLRQSVLVNESMSRGWAANADADSVARLIAGGVERLIIVDGFTPIALEQVGSGFILELVCATSGDLGSLDPGRTVPHVLTVRWFDEGERAGETEVSARVLAGRSDVGIDRAEAGLELTKRGAVLSGVESLSVDFLDERGSWQDTWDVPTVPASVRVVVMVDGIEVERIAVPRVAGAYFEQKDEA